ncbi:MAG: L,D-transpeptidase [Ktedonobacteraceae bacterium]|nr:L,D-transpeptidase [Ktedonobacteraceae bacterium]
MENTIKRAVYSGLIATLLAIIFASCLSSVYVAKAATLARASTWTGQTTNWAYVRSKATTHAPAVTIYAPGTSVTVYATVSGQVVWGGISNWYRISNLNRAPLYIYAGLVVASTGGSRGKVIVVSLSRQWLYAYQNGAQVFNAAVMTGRPSLPTPTGTFHVFAKLSPTTFYSPWPYGSPNWYPPTHINYALEFLRGGYFLHDSWWHTVYGPGTNGWHYDPTYGWQWGSHGCVAMPFNTAAWLYKWAPIGTTVQINP